MFDDTRLSDLLFPVGVVILIALLLLIQLLDWSSIFESSSPGCTRRPQNPFYYGEKLSPPCWRNSVPDASGCEQSPVNIDGNAAVVSGTVEPLVWENHEVEPISMSLMNDGNTAVIMAYWRDDNRPRIQGGPLNCPYEFHSMYFHWGIAEDEGSEHTLDHVRYPMELQVLYVKSGGESLAQVIANNSKDALVVVSYFFQIMKVDNPYLDHIVTNLWRVSSPGKCVDIPAFPLEWIYLPFDSKYYTYSGSLTQPPCSEIVTWIIYSDPIGISQTQLQVFRRLCSDEGPILSNTRPVQKLNGRTIFYYT